MLLCFPSYPHPLYVLQTLLSQNSELVKTTLLKAMKVTVGDKTVKSPVVIYENQTTPFKHTWEYSGSLEELSSFLNNFTALRYASVTSSLALSKPKECHVKHERSHIKDINKINHTTYRHSDCFKCNILSTFFQSTPLPYPNFYSGMTHKLKHL